MNEINGIKVPFLPIVEKSGLEPDKFGNSGVQFNDIFTQELDKIKFSNHALKRMESRNIQFSEAELQRLNNAIEKAEMKGAKDSLIMMDKTAFIINIPNKTVITALQLGNEGNDVFTNIDSVVFG
ncbi:TIGR02530 family flagellar biosynthesis protein [Melioribacteraceae bacterium 4301-Me]|uniref:TIGR02530 family flagellar biosynthesis protein n=1 Tax=Pyranulibacter aquaticus TaxID=3163344 RepID=UPI00359A4930